LLNFKNEKIRKIRILDLCCVLQMVLVIITTVRALKYLLNNYCIASVLYTINFLCSAIWQKMMTITELQQLH